MTGISRVQKRASDAALQIQNAAGRFQSGSKGAQRYNTLAHKLPVLLRTNGLLQTVAFLAAKSAGKGEAAAATAALLADLKQHLTAAGFTSTRGDVIQELCGLEYPVYVRWQEEAVRCAAWLKRFSAAKFGPVDDDTEGGG